MKSLFSIILISIFALPKLVADELPSKNSVAQAFKNHFSNYRSEMSEIKLSNFSGEKLEDEKVFTLYLSLAQKNIKAFLSMTKPDALKGSQFWFQGLGNEPKVWMKMKGGKVREVSGTQAGESFLGSEFSMQQIIPREVKAEDISEPFWGELAGKKHVQVDMRSNSTGPFQKASLFLEPERLLPVQTDFYSDDQVAFQLQFLGYQSIEKQALPSEIKASNLKTKRSSSLQWLSREVNIKFADQLFEPHE